MGKQMFLCRSETVGEQCIRISQSPWKMWIFIRWFIFGSLYLVLSFLGAVKV